MKIANVIDNSLEKISLTQDEKDFLIKAVVYEKFRQASICVEAGGFVGIALSREEVTHGEWFFYWVYPRDPAASDQGGYYNIQYTLKPDGSLLLTRDE
jgi:hypothetical protein